MNGPYLSIVIPTFNEEKRLGPTLEKILAYLRRQTYSWEIVVVDDGSKDGTVALAKGKLASSPHRILIAEKNQGKGVAVKRGMLEAHGKFILFTDADLSTPIEESEKLLSRLEDGFDLAIASRGLHESIVEIHQTPLRETMGKIFNCIARWVSYRGIRDSQCGFKCFPRKIAHFLFEAQRLKGFSFDAEIIYLAQKRGYRIAEIPVIWRNSPDSRVHIFKDSVRMLIDVFRISWIHR